MNEVKDWLQMREKLIKILLKQYKSRESIKNILGRSQIDFGNIDFPHSDAAANVYFGNRWRDILEQADSRVELYKLMVAVLEDEDFRKHAPEIRELMKQYPQHFPEPSSSLNDSDLPKVVIDPGAKIIPGDPLGSEASPSVEPPVTPPSIGSNGRERKPSTGPEITGKSSTLVKIFLGGLVSIPSFGGLLVGVLAKDIRNNPLALAALTTIVVVGIGVVGYLSLERYRKPNN